MLGGRRLHLECVAFCESAFWYFEHLREKVGAIAECFGLSTPEMGGPAVCFLRDSQNRQPESLLGLVQRFGYSSVVDMRYGNVDDSGFTLCSQDTYFSNRQTVGNDLRAEFLHLVFKLPVVESLWILDIDPGLCNSRFGLSLRRVHGFREPILHRKTANGFRRGQIALEKTSLVSDFDPFNSFGWVYRLGLTKFHRVARRELAGSQSLGCLYPLHVGWNDMENATT